MASKFETGHYKNLANFTSLISYLGTVPTYSPDAPELTIAALEAQKTDIENLSDELIEKSAALQIIVNDRQQLFNQTKKLATKIIKYLDAHGIDGDDINDIRSHYKDLFSKKLSKKEIIGEDGSSSIKTYSSNRLSYDSMAENFQKMVELLALTPGYAPTDPAISIVTLKAHYTSLKSMNERVNMDYAGVALARNNRDIAMYQKDTGLVDIALRVKKYLQYRFGTTSDQFNYAKALKFTRKQIRL